MDIIFTSSIVFTKFKNKTTVVVMKGETKRRIIEGKISGHYF